MELEHAEGDAEEDYSVAYDGRDTTVNTPSAGPGYWPSFVLDGLVSGQPQSLASSSQPQSLSSSSHPLATTVRVSSGSSHTSLELPSTPVNSGTSSDSSSSSSGVEIEVSHIYTKLLLY